MKYSLKTKLSFSYVMVALISILLVSIMTNKFLERQFTEYIQQNQEEKNQAIMSSISKQYLNEGKWNYLGVENIGIDALENGLIIKVTEASGEVIWDAQIHNHGMCQRIIMQMSQNMNSQFPHIKGGYVEKPYPVIIDNKKVGTVNIGYYGPFYLNNNDLTFIKTLNKLNLVAGILAMCFALILGFIMAKRLSTPISRVIIKAEMIALGYFGGRIQEKSNTKEILRLTETINNLAQNLENQENLRKRLTADVAHELRTPLATLRGQLEAMIDGIWKPSIDRLKSCHEEIIRLSRLVGDMEMLAQHENNNLYLKETEFDISALIGQVVQNFEGDYLKKDIKVCFSENRELITADKDKIIQVISNLLSNAIKYTPQGGIINIDVEDTGDFIQIIVKDNGIGISEEDLPYIFERFYRADKSRTRLTGGSGIGLTIVKAIVEAHKGKIEVKSKLNEGTEFKIFLPKKAE
ncbi:MAG: sensor histidine kinase [Peptococcales bacterium]|jgi:two-component system sensor histidine kinase BaeS